VQKNYTLPDVISQFVHADKNCHVK